jgi:hypothetical protein
MLTSIFVLIQVLDLLFFTVVMKKIPTRSSRRLNVDRLVISINLYVIELQFDICIIKMKTFTANRRNSRIP